jgi:hypothetical protein
LLLLAHAVVWVIRLLLLLLLAQAQAHIVSHVQALS